MAHVKCYDVAEMVTDEATKQFAPSLKEDIEKKQWLKQCCRMIDKLAEQADGVSYQVDVDDETTDITISLVCGLFEIDTPDDEYYTLLRLAKKVRFTFDTEDLIQISFTFKGIWVLAH